MEVLREVVVKLFWRDCFSSDTLPSREELSASKVSVADLAKMEGKDRISALSEAGVAKDHLALFLRAIHHVTSLHPNHAVGDVGADCFPARSANNWFPTGVNQPLLGHPYVISQERPFTEKEANESEPTPPISSPTVQRAEGFIGLKNQGSTCYLNSLLQVLYHLSSFRLAIYNVKNEETNMTTALQKLFYSLECQESAAETTELTASFGWSSSEAFVQHDIHELTRILLDNLEEKLKNAGDPNVVKQLFCGAMESYVQLKDGQYRNSHDEPFYDIQLVVQGCNSIYDSLDKHFQPNVLDGNNQYCLEMDGKKSYHDAEMGVQFKTCPPVLLCHLTRFDFDPMKGEMCKVLSRWDYYEELNLTKYLPEGEGAEEQGKYCLHGVVVHSGADARYGHYYCFVKRNGKWLKFNDDVVTEVEPREVFGANFGGSKTNYWGSPIPLTTNAYMLVYVKRSEIDSIVRRLNQEEIPGHLIAQMEQERAEAERRAKEKAEEHMYLRVHLVTNEDLLEHPQLLATAHPKIKFSEERSIRTRRTSTADDILEETRAITGIENPLFCVGELRESNVWRLQQILTSSTQLGTVTSSHSFETSRHLIVAVFDRSKCQGNADGPFTVIHHKLFLPHELRCEYIGSTVVGGDVATHVDSLENAVRALAGSKLATASRLSVVQEAEGKSILSSAAVNISNGAVYVWQPQLSEEESAGVFYKDIDEFQSHLRNKVPVFFHKLDPPLFPEVHVTELSLDLTYEQVQKYLARILNMENFDLIRFSRHNPETNAPFFMKIKKKDKSTLRTLMYSSQQQQSKLYFEIGEFTVKELEESNPLIFEFFDDSVKPVSAHTILMPQPGEFTAENMLQMCSKVVGGSVEGEELRLIDVWQGKMFNIFTKETGTMSEKFEESSEYRVERAPKKLDVPEEEQMLLHVQHFTRQNGKIKTHGDPCSMFVEKQELYETFLERLATKLGVPVQSMSDWKPAVVSGSEPHEVKKDVPLVQQYARYLGAKTNTPSHCYLGLEHAPLPTTRRQVRKAERTLKIYN